MISKVKK